MTTTKTCGHICHDPRLTGTDLSWAERCRIVAENPARPCGAPAAFSYYFEDDDRDYSATYYACAEHMDHEGASDVVNLCVTCGLPRPQTYRNERGECQFSHMRTHSPPLNDGYEGLPAELAEELSRGDREVAKYKTEADAILASRSPNDCACSRKSCGRAECSEAARR